LTVEEGELQRERVVAKFATTGFEYVVRKRTVAKFATVRFEGGCEVEQQNKNSCVLNVQKRSLRDDKSWVF
jgi:hypothetical protein